MQKYLEIYRQMISLRGVTDHTIKAYSTYVRAYLDYLDAVLHKLPEDVSWQELRDFIFFIQQQRSLADRTVNTCISQLRFFTLYVLHKPRDHYQLPCRKFDTYLPFVPTKDEVKTFISTLHIQYLTKEEVQEIRDTIDSPLSGLSKRDRAVGMLLLHTGLRGCDISALEINSINWTTEKLWIIQQKTELATFSRVGTIEKNHI